MENLQNEPPKENLISDYVNELRETDLEQHQLAIKRARNTLYLVSVLIFIGEMVYMLASEEGYSHLGMIITLLEAGIFVVFALWTKRKPYYAVLGGIITFIGIHTLAFAYDVYASDGEAAVKTLFGGFIIKIIVLVTLFRALKNAKAIQNYDKI